MNPTSTSGLSAWIETNESGIGNSNNSGNGSFPVNPVDITGLNAWIETGDSSSGDTKIATLNM